MSKEITIKITHDEDGKCWGCFLLREGQCDVYCIIDKMDDGIPCNTPSSNCPGPGKYKLVKVESEIKDSIN